MAEQTSTIIPTCRHCGKRLKPAAVEGWWSLADPDEFDEAVEQDNGSLLWCYPESDSSRHEPSANPQKSDDE
jgi:hypothetical protein